MSSRSPLWELAVPGIQQRPLFGWGFGGLGIAYPFVTNPNNIPEIVNLGQFSYDYIALNGQVRTEKIPTYKAHNLILDTGVSTGILGLLACFALWGYCFYSVIRSPNIGIEAVAIAYTTFAIAWFESAEYAHIFWWALNFSESRLSELKIHTNKGRAIAFLSDKYFQYNPPPAQKPETFEPSPPQKLHKTNTAKIQSQHRTSQKTLRQRIGRRR